MKNQLLLVAIMLLALASCKKDEPSKTTFQIINNVTKYNSDFEPLLDASMYEVVIYGYNEKDEVIKQYNFTKIASGGGKSELTEVTSDIVKVKVSFKFLPPSSAFYSMSENFRHYVKAISYLTKESNTTIVIDDNTMSGNTLKNFNGIIYLESLKLREMKRK